MSDLPLIVGIGERGPTGDHGQDGAQGEPGRRGQQGLDGGGFTRTFLVLHAVEMLIVGAVVSFIIRDQHDSCLRSVSNLQKANDFAVTLQRIEEENPFAETSPEAAATVQDRIDAYQASLRDIPDCSLWP